MATRNTIHVLKKSLVPSQTLPTNGILQGEPLVNIGDGILFFTGGTSGTPTWIQSNNTTPGYFEVGSNLYQLKIRDKIISYSGLTNLSGKFLSGSTNGFVLADITDIAASVDSYVTGATWTPNILTIELNNGKPFVPVTIDSFTALTINGNLFVTGTETVNNLTVTGTGIYNTIANGSNPLEIVNYSSLTAFNQTNDVYVTGSTLTSATNNSDNQSSQLLYHGVPIGGPYTIDTENTYTTGGTYNSGTTSIDFDRNDGVTYSVDLSNIDVNDTYVTGGTSTGATTSSPNATISLTYNQDIVPGTYSLDYLDVYVTGFSYSNNTFTIFDNSGNTYSDTINTVTGLTVNGNLTVTGNTNLSGLTQYDEIVSGTNPLEIINVNYLTGYVQTNDVYVTGATYTPSTDSTDITNWQLQYHSTPLGGPYSFSGENTYVTGGTYNVGTESIDFLRNDGTGFTVDLSAIDINDTYVTGFTYTPSTNTFTIFQNEGEPPLTAIIQEMSGLTVNGDVTITGDLSVFGQAISAFTSQLYVEDPNVIFNYNPTGSTTVTSVNAGMTIQDGSGISGSSVNLDIIRMQNLTGLTATEIPDVSEYTGPTGYVNRGWITQLNDIVIRSTDVTDGGSTGDVNGVRVLAEFDVLDGGVY